MSKVGTYPENSKTPKKQVVGISVFFQAAGKKNEKALWEYLKTRFRGWAYAKKSTLRHWRQMVELGLAREGKSTIHFVRNEELRKGATVVITEDMMEMDAVEAAYMIIQAYYLRTQSLTGKKRHARLRNLRLVSKVDCGGVCLEHMAAAFSRTKAWASQMRRKMERNGWCSYKRRYEIVHESEAQVASHIGLEGRYRKKNNVWTRELTSLCSTVWEPRFRAPAKAGFDLKSGRRLA